MKTIMYHISTINPVPSYASLSNPECMTNKLLFVFEILKKLVSLLKFFIV